MHLGRRFQRVGAEPEKALSSRFRGVVASADLRLWFKGVVEGDAARLFMAL